MSDLGSEAFRLSLRGYAVFPLAEGSKKPQRGSQGFYQASREADVVREFWRQHPQANIGLATGSASGVWVLDIDIATGGKESLEALIAKHGELPKTVACITPGGGIHLYWRMPDADIRNSTSKVGPGIDVRGTGGYVVTPPSRLADGRGYAWVRDPFTHPVYDAPDWLVRLALPPAPSERPRQPISTPDALDRYVAGAIRDELSRLEEAGEGRRNDQLNRSAFAVAGFVKAGFVPEDWAVGQLVAIATRNGLPRREAHETIASAFRAATPREIKP